MMMCTLKLLKLSLVKIFHSNLLSIMTKFIALVVLLSLSLSLSSQNYSLTGQIQDAESQPLIGAVVVLLEALDSTLAAFITSDAEGKFILSPVPKGNYNLQITYVSFGTIQKNLTVEGNEKNIDLGEIRMVPESQLMETVTVTADYIPIRVTKDTVEFNADAFRTQPNAVVEDLLKQLPGVEVERDGSIKVQGEDVKAVTVDGKDFFGKDPKMATRNLPADAVKKVQVYDRKSKTAEFTGVDDGQEEKTINLELKENRRGGYFGNALAGYGTDDRYEGKLMVNRFSRRTQFSAIGTLNNLNNLGIDGGDASVMSGSRESSFMRGGSRNSNIPVSRGMTNEGEINSVTAGVNFNQDLGKKSKVNLSYFLTYDSTYLDKSSLTNSFLPSGDLISNASLLSETMRTQHNIATRNEIYLDSTSEATLIGNYTFRTQDSRFFSNDITSNPENMPLNTNEQSNINNNNVHTLNFSLNYRKKLKKKGRSIIGDASYSVNNADNSYRLLSSILDRNQMLNTDISVFQDQTDIPKNNNYNFGVNYTEPLKKNLFIIGSFEQRNNRADILRDFFDLNPQNLELPGELNEILSRAFDNRFRYNTTGLNLRKVTPAYSWTMGADFQNSILNGNPSVGDTIRRIFNNVLPQASLEIEKIKTRINYTTSVREPSIDQLQPVLDNTNPLNLYQGNPNLVPEYRHNLRIRHHNFNQFTFTSIFASINVSYVRNRITTATLLDPETFVRSSTPVNTRGETSVNGNIFYSAPLNIFKAKYRLGLNSSFINGINILEGIENDIQRWNNGMSVTLENKSKKKFDISGTARLNLNHNIYLQDRNRNTSFLNQTYETYLAWFIGKGWTIDTKMENFIFDQGSFESASLFSLWQASVSKGVWNDKVTFKIKAFDILNQNQGINRVASDIFVQETVANTIGRYFLLGVNYNLAQL